MNLTKLSKFAHSTELLEHAQKAAQAVLRPALEEARQAVLAADSRVQRIEWEQWTPGFNDGDPCVFDLHGCNVYFGDESEEVLEDGDAHEFYFYGNTPKHPIYECYCGCTYIQGEILEVVEKPYRYERRGPGHYEPENGPHQPSEELSAILGELYYALNANMDALENAFGDGYKVIVNVQTGEIETEGVDHD